jgi:curli biogenesis system outer membrane secretion channel CsgG
MKKITVILIGMLMITSGMLISQEKPRLGVLRFTNQVGNLPWWTGTSRVGRELADMLSSELVSTNAFQVLERKEIDAVLTEQDFAASGRVSPATRAKMGQIKGAKYLVAGSVAAYESGVKGVGGGVRIKGVSLGGKKEKAYLAVDIKVIDTDTGEIVDARTIEATTKGSALGANVHLRGGISFGAGGHQKTAVGKAIRACIVYISEYLECSLVEGKDSPCMDKWNKMDEKRREKTKSAIDID